MACTTTPQSNNQTIRDPCLHSLHRLVDDSLDSLHSSGPTGGANGHPHRLTAQRPATEPIHRMHICKVESDDTQHWLTAQSHPGHPVRIHRAHPTLVVVLASSARGDCLGFRCWGPTCHEGGHPNRLTAQTTHAVMRRRRHTKLERCRGRIRQSGRGGRVCFVKKHPLDRLVVGTWS